MIIVLKLPHPLKWGIRDDCINYSKVIEYMSVDEYIHIIEEGLLWKHIHTQQFVSVQLSCPTPPLLRAPPGQIFKVKTGWAP